MRTRSTIIAAVAMSAAAIVAPARGAGPTPAPASQRPTGQIYLVQADPSHALDIWVDGRRAISSAAVGTVVGPLRLTAGRHRVEFRDTQAASRIPTTVQVKPESSNDVVIHLPAQVGGAPVVTLYRTPASKLPAGKARVLLAHTATVPPADVRLDGSVVFTNIANGEFATGDLAAGSHTVSLLPTGRATHALLGPLHVMLPQGTITLVYAVGRPQDGSMNVVTHRETLGSNGVSAPATIDTGLTGLAARIPVHRSLLALRR